MDLQENFDRAGLGAVLRTALDAVVVMGLDGTIIGWNEIAERTFGWSSIDAIGQRMSDRIIPVRYRTAHEHGLARYLATGEGPVLDKHIEIEALHREGHELPVELSITRTEQFGEPVFLGFLRDISERRDAVRRQELMIGELNHRVKNLLGVVAGIAHQTARNAPSVAAFAQAFEGRLASLGRAHEILTQAAWERAPLRVLVQELVGAYARDGDPRLTIEGPNVSLAPRQLLSLTMILHELLTNTVKYGAFSVPEGRVRLGWTVDGSALSLDWTETGLSGVRPPTRQGFGSKMIALSVSHELRGEVNTRWHNDGMAFHLAFPLAEESM